jgi:hypothetical protein
LSAFKSEA